MVELILNHTDINPPGQTLCRIEEEHLWESKQLGAHSPYVLLNTLVYFHTKHFILKTAQDHMSLSFAQILKHLKKGGVPGKGNVQNKNVALRYYCLANGKKGRWFMTKIILYRKSWNFEIHFYWNTLFCINFFYICRTHRGTICCIVGSNISHWAQTLS